MRQAPKALPHSNILNSYPWSLSHCSACGSAKCSLSMLFNESWNVMIEPLRA